MRGGPQELDAVMEEAVRSSERDKWGRIIISSRYLIIGVVIVVIRVIVLIVVIVVIAIVRFARKGTNGVSTNRVMTKKHVFGRGTFWVLICQNLSTSTNLAYLFPKPVRIHYFCSDPLSVDPICPQPSFTASLSSSLLLLLLL